MAVGGLTYSFFRTPEEASGPIEALPLDLHESGPTEAGSYVGLLDLETAGVMVLEPPTPAQGARRVWPDSQGRVWVSEWDAGQVAVYNLETSEWREWRLPGDNPQTYTVYVDERDMVWLSDFGANALVRFDPTEEAFEVFSLPSPGANVRQILGRPGEIWGAESGTDKLVVIRTQ